jgi:hypothetical protein
MTLAVQEENRLTAPEHAELGTLEETVDRGMQTFLDVGAALMTIRDKRLYREQGTFEEYIHARWPEIGRRRAYQLIGAAEVNQNVNHGTQNLPSPANERQVRPLASLPAEQQQLAWRTAVERSGGNTPTGKMVQEVVQEMRQPEPAPAAEESVPATPPADLSRAELDAFVALLRDQADAIGYALWITRDGNICLVWDGRVQQFATPAALRIHLTEQANRHAPDVTEVDLPHGWRIVQEGDLHYAVCGNAETWRALHPAWAIQEAQVIKAEWDAGEVSPSSAAVCQPPELPEWVAKDWHWRNADRGGPDTFQLERRDGLTTSICYSEEDVYRDASRQNALRPIKSEPERCSLAYVPASKMTFHWTQEMEQGMAMRGYVLFSMVPPHSVKFADTNRQRTTTGGYQMVTLNQWEIDAILQQPEPEPESETEPEPLITQDDVQRIHRSMANAVSVLANRPDEKGEQLVRVMSCVSNAFPSAILGNTVTRQVMNEAVLALVTAMNGLDLKMADKGRANESL